MKLNRAHFAEFFRTDYYTISVIFPITASTNTRDPSKQYTYKVPQGVKLEVGDRVVTCAESVLNVRTLGIPTVVAIHENPQIEEDTGFNFKWIVGKFDDIMTTYVENQEKDLRLKKAVAKLEQKLEQISLRKQLAMAMDELGTEDKEELQALFGVDLTLPKVMPAPGYAEKVIE